MADITNVDPQEIRMAVSKMDGVVNGIAVNVGKIEEVMAALDKGWKSVVKDEFFSRYRTDAEAMREMIDQYEEISQVLTECAMEYEKADNDIKSQTGKFK